MLALIYQRSQFERRLQRLHRAGGKGAQTARQVERIIRQLCAHDAMKPEQTGKLTRYGEARIEKCRKLDLGGGYRLIYLKRGATYLLLYLGTHDECDRWLRRNAGFEATGDASRFEPVSGGKDDNKGSERFVVSARVENDESGKERNNLDERMLRRIFCGLTGEKP